MSKAILVLDEMPTNCMQCRFRDDDCCSVDDYAKSDGSLVIYRDKHDFKRHDSCPLKPMPAHVMDNNTFAVENKYMCYQDGYNACLDEILGGKDESK